MSTKSTKDELLEEAAEILEQEGWLVGRHAHELSGSSARWNAFSKRYSSWQEKVNQARKQGLDMWPEPPDNS